MAQADPGQPAFHSERHSGQQLPHRRRGPGLHPAQGDVAPLVPTHHRSRPNCALYTADGLDARGQPPSPDNVIPANLIDPNAVLEVNAGTFPKPNFNNGTQYIASIAQPTQVREDIVRIDHTFSSKYQLMGHYLHDTLLQDYFPPLWGDSTYPTVGTIMTNPSFSAVIKLTQTYSPNLLNETGFYYSGNKITLTPTPGPGGGTLCTTQRMERLPVSSRWPTT